MLGITMVRKLLGLTGEEFGRQFEVSKATVSFWDKGKITDAKAEDISKEYGVAKELLIKELTPAEQMQIQTDIYKYQARNSLSGDDEQTYDELTANAYKARCEAVANAIAIDSNLLDILERVSNIRESHTGIATLNILLAAAEKYLQMDKHYMSLKVGATSYEDNCMYSDDQVVSIIVSALHLALDEPNKK